MPFVVSSVSTVISPQQEQALKARMGKAIELVPGKSEEYLLLVFHQKSHIYIRGRNDAPSAYIEAHIFGNEGHDGYAAFSKVVTNAFHEILGIPWENIYINFTDIPVWSAAGICFDRNRIYAGCGE